MPNSINPVYLFFLICVCCTVSACLALTWGDYEIEFLNVYKHYQMVTPSPDVKGCNFNESEPIRLFVFVPTRPNAFERRAVIRSTWASQNITWKYGIVVKFVIGNSTNSNILSELNTFGDLIINDLEDTYDNLVYKIYSAFQWFIDFCSDANYILKTDDDTAVDLERLIYWIDHEFQNVSQQYPSTVFGGVWQDAFVMRNESHKWYVPEHIYPKKSFPPYANGATYLLTRQAVVDILIHSRYVKAFNIEDALLTGVVGEAANITKYNAPTHFRRGIYNNKIRKYEKCNTDGVPYVISFYDFPNDDVVQAYHDLHNARCEQNLFLALI